MKIVPYLYTPRQIFGVPGQVEVGAFKARDVAKLMMGDRKPFGPYESSPRILSHKEALIAHSRDYVDSVMERGETGFGGHFDRANSPVTAIRYAAGNFLSAVDLATSGDSKLVMSLTSGFHHAGFDYGWGFCTFNALMIAAIRHIRNPKWDFKPVLILDGDAHHGDGCVDIIDQLSLKAKEVQYISVPGFSLINYEVHLAAAVSRIREGEFGLVLYQPGADSLIEDRFQAGSLTRDEFVNRDERVFYSAVKSSTPLVFNLAGGYGAPGYKSTLMAHYNSWRTANRILNLS